MTSKPQDSASTQSPEAVQLSAWQRFWQAQRDNIQVLAIALVMALVIRLFIAEPRYIPSDSMAPTLHVGDRLVVEKISYRLHDPARGDIVVFDPPEQLQQLGFHGDQAFIKRIVGEPGQTIQVHQGKVYIDQQPLQEPYIAEAPKYEMPPVQIPAGSYFVMGDNRNNSNDSHVWGFLPKSNIIGRAVFRFWAPDRVGRVDI
ncbi:MAG TPA: signal peptidase I [Crinalium sp.]|jgi:signal peptidase I